jgi:hypothetical protein
MCIPHNHSTRHFAAERTSAEVEHWAHVEGKSETMSADLIESATMMKRRRSMIAATVCPHCFASATMGAAVALLIERLVMGN